MIARYVKPVFHVANLFARREAKTRIRQRNWLKLVGEKIRPEQVGTVPTFFFCSREQIRQVENGLYTLQFRLRLVSLQNCETSCIVVFPHSAYISDHVIDICILL